MSKIKIQDALDRDIYNIEMIDVVKHIHIDGYFYLNENGGELNQYCLAMMPLDEFISKLLNEEEGFEVDDFLSEHKCYITDYKLTDEEYKNQDFERVLTKMQQDLDSYQDEHSPTTLKYKDLSVDTPCGLYINL